MRLCRDGYALAGRKEESVGDVRLWENRGELVCVWVCVCVCVCVCVRKIGLYVGRNRDLG